jgi:putative nucleotidyltransferase with HDIG domain
MEDTRGTLVLKAVPDGGTGDVEAFLTKVFKGVSPEKVSRMIAKAPVVLSKNIPSQAGAKLVSRLEGLGASVDFVPRDSDGDGLTGEIISHDDDPRSVRPVQVSPPVESAEPALPRSTRTHESDEPAVRANWMGRVKAVVLKNVAEVNKELWLILSLILLAAVMNYLVAANRMVLGFYTLPTLFSAYFYGRRHATLTAFASVFLIGLLAHYNPNLLAETETTQFVDGRWYDLTAWAGILVITAYAMGTLHEHHESRVQELRQTYHGLLLILRQFISKDKYTENHSYRVSIYATKIASYLGLSDTQIEDIRDAALLHDIGKLDVSRQILHKAARLNDQEYEGMKKHVEKGVGILEPVGGPLRRILPIILAHHDKFDGSGYHPLSGEDIPLEARVIAVADVYDSLTSDRPYRKAMSTYDAKDIIVKGSGTEFDPKIVNAFLAAFRKGEMEVPEVLV